MGFAADDLNDPGQDLHGGRPGRQLAAHREKGPGLVLAGNRRLLADPEQGGHLAHEQADGEEEDEV